MWASLSLLLAVLMLALSLRFYWSHCLPPSGKSGGDSPIVSIAQRHGLKNWKHANTSMTPTSPSSKRDSHSKKIRMVG